MKIVKMKVAELKGASWQKITKLYLTTTDRAVKAEIEKEAKACGYNMSGLIVAHVLTLGR